MAEDRVVIKTDAAPAPIGPYSQAIKFGDMVFLAGQIALDPKTGKMIQGDTAQQCELILKNIGAILQFAGLTMGHIVRCVVYLVDLKDMPQVNEAFGRHFIYEPPARTSVQVVALPGGARVEIEATAMIPARVSAKPQVRL